MSAPGEFRPGDEYYTTLYDRWVTNKRPNQFETVTDAGTARWRVHDIANGPTFLLIAGAGPTSTGYNEDTGKFKSAEWPGPTSGYEVEARDVGLEITEGAHPNDFAIKMIPPPKDLAAMEDVLQELV